MALMGVVPDVNEDPSQIVNAGPVKRERQL